MRHNLINKSLIWYNTILALFNNINYSMLSWDQAFNPPDLTSFLFSSQVDTNVKILLCQSFKWRGTANFENISEVNLNVFLVYGVEVPPVLLRLTKS